MSLVKQMHLKEAFILTQSEAQLVQVEGYLIGHPELRLVDNPDNPSLIALIPDEISSELILANLGRIRVGGKHCRMERAVVTGTLIRTDAGHFFSSVDKILLFKPETEMTFS